MCGLHLSCTLLSQQPYVGALGCHTEYRKISWCTPLWSQGDTMELDLKKMDDQTVFALQLYVADCLDRQKRACKSRRLALEVASELGSGDKGHFDKDHLYVQEDGHVEQDLEYDEDMHPAEDLHNQEPDEHDEHDLQQVLARFTA